MTWRRPPEDKLLAEPEAHAMDAPLTADHKP